MCQTAYFNFSLKNMFIISVSIYIPNFLEKHYGFYVTLRIIIKERLKNYDKFLF